MRGSGLTSSPVVSGVTLTRQQWLICCVAAIGFAFDTYELLMVPLIVRPALVDLTGARPDSAEFGRWVGILFYVPAIAGGIFGLLGGYLTDRLGRRRVLVWSILLYGVSALASAYASSVGVWLALRCATFVGVSVEFVAAVAWLAELFPDHKQREAVLGYTQAFSSLGGLLISSAYTLLASNSGSLPAVMGGHAPWRYALISAVVPAIPLIVIRPFLPESPVWQEKKAKGTLRRASFSEIFQPQYRKTTLLTALMFACSYGAAFGAIQHMPRIVPDLPEVVHLAPALKQAVVGKVQFLQELGGLVGRCILAVLAVRIVSRRTLLRIFQIPGLFIVPFVFFYPAMHSLEMVRVGIFMAGMVTVAQFSFWGNYLPRVYPTYLRGTGESFAANVGGRMIGTCAALITTQLVSSMPGASVPIKLAYASALVGTTAYVIGFIASFWLPEPEKADLPD